MLPDELLSKVRELKVLKQTIDKLQTESAQIEDSIKAVMEEENTEEMLVDVFKIRWTTVKSERFDTTAFKKTHKELYEQYLKQNTSKRFSIT